VVVVAFHTPCRLTLMVVNGITVTESKEVAGGVTPQATAAAAPPSGLYKKPCALMRPCIEP
jgi:hypothetical protein